MAKTWLLVLQKHSTIDFWWGSKYDPGNTVKKTRHLKDISPVI